MIGCARNSARDLQILERAAGQSDPRPGVIAGAANASEGGVALARLPLARHGQSAEKKTPLALRRISLSRRTPNASEGGVALARSADCP